jgi:hypothetical protein
LKCWASSLGGCSEKTSREHYISQGLWTGNSIHVQGLPWCGVDGKTIGLGSATAHLLCKRHNSDLSELDDAAKISFAALRDASELSNSRLLIAPREWMVQETDVNGLALERWFLKTSLNLYVLHSSQNRWRVGSVAEEVPAILVRIVFGLEPFLFPMGLRAVLLEGETLRPDEAVECTWLLDGENRIIATAYSFQGTRFLLALSPEPFPKVFRIANSRSPEWILSKLVYHSRSLRWFVRGELSNTIEFHWVPSDYIIA